MGPRLGTRARIGGLVTEGEKKLAFDGPPERQGAAAHAMTDRQRILAAIRGETPDHMPFVPRLDFWYRARRYTNTFPPALRSLSLMEIADRLGVGCYGNVPYFSHCVGHAMAN